MVYSLLCVYPNSTRKQDGIITRKVFIERIGSSMSLALFVMYITCMGRARPAHTYHQYRLYLSEKKSKKHEEVRKTIYESGGLGGLHEPSLRQTPAGP